MKFNLFHALRGKPTTNSQTDRSTSRTSGDSRERPAFDWRSVPAVDPDEVDRWLGCTDAKDRQFPLQVALQVHDEIERLVMAPGEVDDADLREARGGMRALRRFAELYSKILEGR